MRDFTRQATGQLGQQQSQGMARGATAYARTPRESTGSTLLRGIVGLVENISTMKFQDRTEELYVQGQRARYQEQAFDKLDSNLLTRSFLRGGYQDQDFRMDLASELSKATAYIQEGGDAVPPQAFQQWYSAQMNEVLNRMGDGGSREARRQMVQMVMQQEASVAEMQAEAHSKYQMDVKGKAYAAHGQAVINLANNVRAIGGDLTPIMHQVHSTLQEIDQDSLPREVRNEFKKNFMRALFDADLHEFHAMVDPTSPMFALDGFDFDDIHALNEDSRAAMKRTEFERSHDAIQMAYALEARWKAGLPLQPEEVQRAIDMFQSTPFDSSKWLVKLMHMQSENAGNSKNEELGRAWLEGQQSLIYLNDSDIERAGNHAHSYIFTRFPDDSGAAMETLLRTATRHWGEVPRRTITTIEESMRAVTSGSPDAQAEKVIMGLDNWRLMEGENTPEGRAVWASILSQVDDNTRRALSLTATRAITGPVGEKYSQSVMAEAEKAVKDLTAPELNEHQRSILKEAYEKSESDGSWAAFKRKVLSWSAEDYMRPGSPEWGVRRQEIYETMQHMIGQPGNMFMGADDLLDAATQVVNSQTFYIRDANKQVQMLHMGPEFRDNLDRAFKAINPSFSADSMSQVEIQEALNTIFPEVDTKETALEYAVLPGGVLTMRASIAGKESYLETTVYPEEIAHQVYQARDQKAQRVNSSIRGQMVQNQQKGGIEFTFQVNGSNSSGLDKLDVFDWRTELAGLESTPGRVSGGVGFSTQEYAEATDQAIQEARNALVPLGVDSNQYLILAGATQFLHTGNMDGVPEFLAEVIERSDGSEESVRAALRETGAFAGSRETEDIIVRLLLKGLSYGR